MRVIIIMKKLLIAATLLACTALPAAAQLACSTDGSGNTFCDPTSFHVTDSKATGQDPVLLNENTTFNIDEINNDIINKPLTIFFAVPVGDAKPVITKFDFNGGPFTTFAGTLSNDGVWTPGNGKGQDLYSFIGCAKCDPSINMTNVDAVDGTGVKFNVYDLVINQGFTNKGIETIDGLFATGTLIAPLAEDIVVGKGGKTTTTFYDTSWTNTGAVNTLSSPVPEPRTWVMMLSGFVLMAAFGYRRRHKMARYIEA
jgi:hypothetical protein